MLKLGTQMKLSLDFKLLLKHVIDPLLIHVRSHGVAWSVLERLIFEVKFNFVLAIFSFDNIKVNFDSSLWNRFVVFGLTEFDLVTENVTNLVEVEYLVDINLAPLIYNLLDDVFSRLLVHLVVIFFFS